MTIRADRRGIIRRAVLGRQAQPFSLDRFYVAGLPDAALWTGAQVHVLDEIDGAVTCFSDGVNWRRITDLTIASAAAPAALSFAGETAGALDAVVGPYLVFTGVGSATFEGASFVGAGVSSTGEADCTLAMLGGFVSTDLSFTGASTSTFVGDLGTGEPAGFYSVGAGDATFDTLLIGGPARLTSAGVNLTLFRGAAA